MFIKPIIFFLTALCTLMSSSLLYANEDQITKTITEATQQYQNHQFTAAIASLEYASQMIRQKKGEALIKLLPEPLEGWKADNAESQTMGSSMFGGETTVVKQYTKSKSKLIIKYATDSPRMQTLIMMFNNPAFASSSGKLEIINGQKAIVNFKENSGNVNIAINNNLLITLEGDDLARDDLIAYAQAIDYSALGNLP